MTEHPGGQSVTSLNDRKRRRLRRRLIVALVLTAGGALSAVTFRRPWFQGNFGVVDTERVYRSAQPQDGLPRLIRERSIASILNLRGGSPTDPWYAAEVRASRELGVDFYDFPMSATQRPSRRELLVLIDLFTRCRYPILIHCRSGSDRTGLASALYLLTSRGDSPAVAIASFSVNYGHVPLLGTQRLHEPFTEYEAWLRDRGLDHTPERFRGWVARDYVSDDPNASPPPLATGPRIPGFAGRVGEANRAVERDRSRR